MKISKELAKEAKCKGICKSWLAELKGLEDKKQMVHMYLKGIDFCLSNDYPSNEYIRANFKGVMESLGVFLDDRIVLVNIAKCVSLGSTKGSIEITGFGCSEIFVKHTSELTIIAKDDAFIMVDVFDDAIINIQAHDRAKVCVNRYMGATIVPYENDCSVIKIVEKIKKTY
ncbi:hypothetical protein AwDysgo_12910 [Bacteroidales bacterium]|nr:hypothetical protein AwDysgo_12910 [Bacteroidales bacterium]